MKLHLNDSGLSENATLILGVSGGRDSMALCHALLKERPDLKLIVAHLDHGLRENSSDDADFVRGMMERWKLPFELLKARPPKSGNLEAWGREKRYEFFEKLRKKHQADFIVTAHHQDDDLETLLMHLLRGTRVKGLSGMAYERGKLLRPLLFTPRSEINRYVEEHQIHFREDPSNQNENLTRNFLRHKVVPALTQVHPDFPERWQKQKYYWTELQSLLERDAQKFLKEHLTSEGLLRAPYRELPYPIRATVLELWHQQSTGERVPDSRKLERWDEAILHWNSRKKTEWDSDRFLVLTKKHAILE